MAVCAVPPPVGLELTAMAVPDPRPEAARALMVRRAAGQVPVVVPGRAARALMVRRAVGHGRMVVPDRRPEAAVHGEAAPDLHLVDAGWRVAAQAGIPGRAIAPGRREAGPEAVRALAGVVVRGLAGRGQAAPPGRAVAVAHRAAGQLHGRAGVPVHVRAAAVIRPLARVAGVVLVRAVTPPVARGTTAPGLDVPEGEVRVVLPVRAGLLAPGPAVRGPAAIGLVPPEAAKSGNRRAVGPVVPARGREAGMVDRRAALGSSGRRARVGDASRRPGPGGTMTGRPVTRSNARRWTGTWWATS